jgi:hypothetical protein
MQETYPAHLAQKPQMLLQDESAGSAIIDGTGGRNEEC